MLLFVVVLCQLRIGLLDWGQTKELSRQDREKVANVILAVSSQLSPDIVQSWVSGLRIPFRFSARRPFPVLLLRQLELNRSLFVLRQLGAKTRMLLHINGGKLRVNVSFIMRTMFRSVRLWSFCCLTWLFEHVLRVCSYYCCIPGICCRIHFFIR